MVRPPAAASAPTADDPAAPPNTRVWHTTPEDHLHQILSFLLLDDLFSCAAACRAWAGPCRRSPHVDTGPRSLSNADVRKLLRLCGAHVATLRLQRAAKLDMDTLRLPFSGACPNLRELVVHKLHVISDAAALALEAVARHARHGSASGSAARASAESPAAKLSTAGCLTLESLDLGGTLFIDAETSRALAAAPNLKDLWLEGCRHLSDADAAHITGALDGLRRLRLCDCTALRDPHLASKRLELLHVSGCANLNTVTFATDALAELEANFCTQLTDTAVEDILEACPRLRVLRARGCAQLQRPNLRSESLVELDLQLCSQLSEPVVTCAALQVLELGMCRHLAAATLRLASIETVDLSMLPLKSLNLSGCRQLRSLNLSGCSSLLSYHLKMADCALLKVLDVCGSSVDLDGLDGAAGIEETRAGGQPLGWPDRMV